MSPPLGPLEQSVLRAQQSYSCIKNLTINSMKGLEFSTTQTQSLCFQSSACKIVRLFTSTSGVRASLGALQQSGSRKEASPRSLKGPRTRANGAACLTKLSHLSVRRLRRTASPCHTRQRAACRGRVFAMFNASAAAVPWIRKDSACVLGVSTLLPLSCMGNPHTWIA